MKKVLHIIILLTALSKSAIAQDASIFPKGEMNLFADDPEKDFSLNTLMFSIFNGRKTRQEASTVIVSAK